MADWFRNEHWDDEVAGAFEAKLGRARDKAQYLTIQGFTLIGSNPEAAALLLRRAADLDDPMQTARAYLYLGTALACSGDIDGAIEALQDAIDTEERHPMHRTAAGLDQALLIAMAGRAELYDTGVEAARNRAHRSIRDAIAIGADRSDTH